jgi:ferredoxin
MLRQIAAGDMSAAIATVKRDIALPAVLGRICPAPCEKACRRGVADAAVSICQLKRLVADVDLASGEPYRPPCQPSPGRRVAIVGAGPTGLSAAYYLAQQGHACTLFDENATPGGRLLRETTEAELPRDVLAAEIGTILRLGIQLHVNARIDDLPAFDRLHKDFDAVLVATGATAGQQAAAWGLRAGPRGVQIKAATFETSLPGVFAAGNAIRGKGMVIRSAADGKEAAVAISQYLAGETVAGEAVPFSTKIGRMEADEFRPMLGLAGATPRQEPSGGVSAGYSAAEGAEQAARCIHCDCRGLNTCKLRKYAALYGAEPRRYKAERRKFEQDSQHAEVLFEPGKCIDCGLCIQIAAAAGEPLGLTFIGRGFDVRVGVPLDHSLAEALHKVAAECVAACPTAALAWKRERPAASCTLRNR